MAHTEPIYIPRSEFARIFRHANSSLDILDDRAELNQARKAVSDKRVSTWTNTLEASVRFAQTKYTFINDSRNVSCNIYIWSEWEIGYFAAKYWI